MRSTPDIWLEFITVSSGAIAAGFRSEMTWASGAGIWVMYYETLQAKSATLWIFLHNVIQIFTNVLLHFLINVLWICIYSIHFIFITYRSPCKQYPQTQILPLQVKAPDTTRTCRPCKVLRPKWREEKSTHVSLTDAKLSETEVSCTQCLKQKECRLNGLHLEQIWLGNKLMIIIWPMIKINQKKKHF